MDTGVLSSDASRWQDLPGAVLSHLLELAPYKRADVKLVCQSWRCAINAAIKTVSLPADDLNLLHQLTAVQNLTAVAPRAGAQIIAERHNAAAANSSGKAPATHSSAATSSTAANPWCAAHPSTMQRLQFLHLQGCPAAFHQLAEWQTEQLHASSSSGSRGNSSRTGLDSLQVLQLTQQGDVATALAQVLTGRAGQQGCLNPGSASSSGAAIQPWALQHLSQLQISHCRLGAHASSDVLALSALQQLPALQSLELSHCQLLEVPAAVCACTALTQLNLGHNDIKCVTPQLANLQRLKVLDLSSNTLLCSLHGAVGHLTSLTELDLSGPNRMFCDVRGEADASCSSDAHVAALPAVDENVMPDLLPVGLFPLPHHQQLQALPDLAHLTNLHKLSLAHNRDMAVLPGSLSVLTQLEVLDARSCSLRFPPDELWSCVGLRELLLGDNVLAGLPDDISSLQKLEVLDIGRCMTLWQLPAALLSLSQLRRLVLATKAVGQYIVERLELRSTNPVDVEFDAEEHSGDEGEDVDLSQGYEDDLPELLEVVDLGIGPSWQPN